MLPKTQMIQRSQYGAFFVKLNCMEFMKQEKDILRLVEIHSQSCEKPITCLKMVVIQKSGQPNEYFYASLYDGLYYGSQNEPDEATVHLIAACQSPYGSRSDYYMAALAKVHCKCRNGNIN